MATSQKDLEDYTIKYPGEEDLGAFLDGYTEDFLICTSVDVKTYRRFEKWRDDSGRHYRLFFPGTDPDPETDTEINRLFITIPTEEHEKSHVLLSAIIVVDMANMGRGPLDWVNTAASTRRHRRGGGGIEGDSTMFSFPEREDGGGPTLVIESGRSQSLPRLRSKMEYWFDKSRHEVHIVLLVKLSLTRREILIEKYTEGVSPQGGPVISNGALKPFLRQSITIVPDANANPVTYSVSRGALILEFALLCLRPAVSRRGEHDIIVTEDTLAAYARRVWGHLA